MAPALPDDFKEFLKSLNQNGVRYLLIGGHAVSFHGYPRPTEGLDIWIARDHENARKTVQAIRDFGFDTPNLAVNLFEQENSLVRMGIAPLRIEVKTSISGVEFEEAESRAIVSQVEGLAVPTIGLDDLKRNKLAAGRLKDLADLDSLP